MGDLRRLAERSLPRGVFDYVDGGAEDELTLRRNVEAFQRLEFRPRVLRDVGAVDTTRRLLGRTLPLPLVLGPTGFTRIVAPEGGLAVARSAARHGLPYTLSTLSTRSIEEVAAASDGPKWFQVYVWRDRGLVREMLEHADRAGYEAIVLTVDTPVLGRRERDVRHGFTLPPQLGLETLLDGVRHPAWTWRFVRSDPIKIANVAGRSAAEVTDAVHLADYISAQFDPTVSWPDLEWFRSHWSKPIVVKGIQSVDDTVVAADLGLDAIALSNHGGRQVDGSPRRWSWWRRVAAAVGGRVEIICDGGIRPGRRHRQGDGVRGHSGHDRTGLPLGTGGSRRAGCRSRPRAFGRRNAADHGADRPPDHLRSLLGLGLVAPSARRGGPGLMGPVVGVAAGVADARWGPWSARRCCCQSRTYGGSRTRAPSRCWSRRWVRSPARSWPASTPSFSAGVATCPHRPTAGPPTAHLRGQRRPRRNGDHADRSRRGGSCRSWPSAAAPRCERRSRRVPPQPPP